MDQYNAKKWTMEQRNPKAMRHNANFWENLVMT